MTRKELYRTVLWSLSVLGVLAFIYTNSLMPATVSDAQSGEVFSWVSKLFPFLTHHLVRKLAHFSEYALLGAHFAFLPFLVTRRPIPMLATALVAGPLFAFADEGLQRLVPGRSGNLADVFIDVLGYFCAAFIFFTVLLSVALVRRKKHRAG